jgi:transketolase
MDITLIPEQEFRRVREAVSDKYTRLALLADMCRLNALSAVKRAGSGHLGSSFSAMDIVVWLYHEELNTIREGIDSPDRDVYFSSKGHDVPGLYSVLHSLGIVPEEKLLKLRRLHGLDGHPNVKVRGVEVNSGSLGMGISKGRGMVWAKRHLGRGGRVFVMTGDGELQEGQNYEALHAAVHQRVTDLTVIVDHNKLQSDLQVSEIMGLGDLEAVFRDFGWHVARCDGHDWKQLERVFGAFKTVTDRPKILIADTIKGRGVSFMEHPRALADNKGFYKWHAGAPDDESFLAAHEELAERINGEFRGLGLAPLTLLAPTPEGKLDHGNALGEPISTGGQVSGNALGEPLSTGGEVLKTTKVSDEYVAVAYGEALVEIGAERADLVVLDADLSADCRLRGFEHTYPDRFIENGIAEQDMVSMAGGLARHGLLPVVNSFASFLASRANEQIYNNATELSKIVYACHYGGLIPAGPGTSHQSIRDISLFGALPNVVIVEPCNASETRMALRYLVNDNDVNGMLRLIIGPSPRKIELPGGYAFTPGRGVTLAEGGDAVVFAYGPVMLHEALRASEALKEQGFGLKVVNMPWLNRVDAAWLKGAVAGFGTLYVLEDHAPVGGLGDFLLNALVENGLLGAARFKKFAVEGYPACGTPPEVLDYHGLDGPSLAKRILAEAR